MSRPLKDVDMKLVRALAQRYLSQRDIAVVIGVHEDTLARRIKDDTGLTFKDFREEQLAHTRASLTQKALAMALKDTPNTTMLIFCLKQICGWGEGEQNIGVNVNTQVNHVTISKEELQDRMKQLVDKHGKTSGT